MRALLPVALLLLTLPASALCLNPFGCKPQTRAECVKQADAARTESAAKAQLRECTRLPLHTEKECKGLTREWANHLRATGGIEWNWAKLSSKDDCKDHHPETFKASAWVAQAYCEAQEFRIEAGAKETDPISGRSRRIIAAGAKADSIVGLTDRMAVKVMQRVHYQDMTPEELAIAVFIDSPPDVLQVQEASRALQKR